VYISVDVTTLTSNLRPGCLGLRVFAITREIAAEVLPVLLLAYARCSLKESRWSIMTPKYLRLGRDVIVASPILIVAAYTFFLVLIRTASVLCAARASPLESCHVLARFPALLQILSASERCLATNKECPFRHRDPKDPIVHGIPQYISAHLHPKQQC